MKEKITFRKENLKNYVGFNKGVEMAQIFKK